MRRRELIGLLGGAAVSWPVAARAQQKAMPVIGFLCTLSSAAFAPQLAAAFRQGLGEAGYVEGKNVAVEYRWAEDRYDRLPGLAQDLVRRQVTVIVAVPHPAAVAAKAATATIPIVFTSAVDPVREGLVKSLGRPDGNVTGVSQLIVEMGAKHWELLRELVPAATVFGLLVNPTNPNAETQAQDAGEAARTTGMRTIVVNASSETELAGAFAHLIEQHAAGLIVGADPVFSSSRERLVGLAARHALPAIYSLREYAVAGGLISYGTSLKDAMRQVGLYTGKILAGAKPADLPVMQPTRFELVINLKTAKALGLAVPQSLLARADEVIE
jgi:putative tryptophan/tyrosine transport system substrate-binding protein